MMEKRQNKGLRLKRKPYPPEFIEALLETAERAKSKDVRAPYIVQRLRNMLSRSPSPEIAKEMKALVPQLCWIIKEAGGWFYGPGAEY